MATYEYRCPDDGDVLIVARSMIEDELSYDCSICGKLMQRVYTSPPVKFNGSGFYSTGG